MPKNITKAKECVTGLIDFLNHSQSTYQAVDEIKSLLDANHFKELKENKKFEIHEDGKYYVVRNGSSIIAFTVGGLNEYRFKIAASHSDSPCFKLKENAEIRVKDKYVQLNTEGYGGMLLAPWLDRPLSIAGRVIIKNAVGGANGSASELTEKHVAIDRDLVLIPNVAIHMNRKVNDGYAYNKQVDMLPLFGGKDSKDGDLKAIIAKEAGVNVEDIVGSDLYLYNRVAPSVWGANEEFISAARLDDLECAYTTLSAFINARKSAGINVFACFDNEETGSQSLQGAGSTFLYDTLKRINLALNKNEEDYYCAVADSFMLSCDNAHSVHPNHPEKTDATNAVYMNEGIVIKSNANQKYTSDAASIAKFKLICEKAKVPYQFFANRSDEPGGSTLGNISMSQVSMHAVDIGLAQLAMHSPYETAGVMDIEYMVKAVKVFYEG